MVQETPPCASPSDSPADIPRGKCKDKKPNTKFYEKITKGLKG